MVTKTKNGNARILINDLTKTKSGNAYVTYRYQKTSNGNARLIKTFGQRIDTFDDGDYTNNPEWVYFGNGDIFVYPSEKRIRFRVNNSYTEMYIKTNVFSKTNEWSFNFKPDSTKGNKYYILLGHTASGNPGNFQISYNVSDGYFKYISQAYTEYYKSGNLGNALGDSSTIYKGVIKIVDSTHVNFYIYKSPNILVGSATNITNNYLNIEEVKVGLDNNTSENGVIADFYSLSYGDSSRIGNAYIFFNGIQKTKQGNSRISKHYSTTKNGNTYLIFKKQKTSNGNARILVPGRTYIDTFSDGDYTNNPEWTVLSGSFSVQSTVQLRDTYSLKATPNQQNDGNFIHLSLNKYNQGIYSICFRYDTENSNNLIGSYIYGGNDSSSFYAKFNIEDTSFKAYFSGNSENEQSHTFTTTASKDKWYKIDMILLQSSGQVLFRLYSLLNVVSIFIFEEEWLSSSDSYHLVNTEEEGYGLRLYTTGVSSQQSYTSSYWDEITYNIANTHVYLGKSRLLISQTKTKDGNAYLIFGKQKNVTGNAYIKIIHNKTKFGNANLIKTVAQKIDNFEDNDYTNNPTWVKTGDASVDVSNNEIRIYQTNYNQYGKLTTNVYSQGNIWTYYVKPSSITSSKTKYRLVGKDNNGDNAYIEVEAKEDSSNIIFKYHSSSSSYNYYGDICTVSPNIYYKVIIEINNSSNKVNFYVYSFNDDLKGSVLNVYQSKLTISSVFFELVDTGKNNNEVSYKSVTYDGLFKKGNAYIKTFDTYQKTSNGNSRLLINFSKNKASQARLLIEGLTRSEEGNARLLFQYSISKTSNARLLSTIQKLKNGNSRLLFNNLTKQVNANSRLLITHQKLKNGNAYISTSGTLLKYGNARLLIENNQKTRLGNAHIRIPQYKLVDGNSRILIIKTIIKNSVSRLLVVFEKTSNSNARIHIPKYKLVNGNSNLLVNASKQVFGNSRLVIKGYTKTTQSNARLHWVVEKNKVGIGNLIKTKERLKYGTARLLISGVDNGGGNARIEITFSKTSNSNSRLVLNSFISKQGTANIAFVRSVDKIGNADLFLVVNKLVTGNSFLKVGSNVTNILNTSLTEVYVEEIKTIKPEVNIKITN